jgi:XapX domain-containing protein
MKEIFLALIAGLIVGMLFKFLKLPLPAPPVFSAVVGVFGVYFGGVLLDWIMKMFQHS